MTTRRLEAAFAFANRLHSKQRRKGTTVPYVSHLIGVASLVFEYGGDEDQVIAALLHDAVEDQAASAGGAAKLRQRIRKQFGSEVLRIVDACTDADVEPKPPWKARKVAYLKHLAAVDDRIALVSCCDKLHNARAILSDIRRHGQRVFDRFSASKSETLWYYRSLARAYGRHRTLSVVKEFRGAVNEMTRLAGHSAPSRRRGQRS